MNWPRCQSYIEQECGGVIFLQECKVEKGGAAQSCNTLLNAGWNVRLGACEVTQSGGISSGVGVACRIGV
eukprot:4179611-Pyramimonas_sp.AAC.1